MVVTSKEKKSLKPFSLAASNRNPSASVVNGAVGCCEEVLFRNTDKCLVRAPMRWINAVCGENRQEATPTQRRSKERREEKAQGESVIKLLTADTQEVLALPNFMVHRIVALVQRGLLVDDFLRTSVHGGRYFHHLQEVLVGNRPKEPSEHWVRQVRREIVDEQAEEREAGEGRASRFNMSFPEARDKLKLA